MSIEVFMRMIKKLLPGALIFMVVCLNVAGLTSSEMSMRYESITPKLFHLFQQDGVEVKIVNATKDYDKITIEYEVVANRDIFISTDRTFSYALMNYHKKNYLLEGTYDVTKLGVFFYAPHEWEFKKLRRGESIHRGVVLHEPVKEVIPLAGDLTTLKEDLSSYPFKLVVGYYPLMGSFDEEPVYRNISRGTPGFFDQILQQFDLPITSVKPAAEEN